MFEFAAKIIILFGIAGMALMILSKIPVLVNLQEIETNRKLKPKKKLNFKKKKQQFVEEEKVDFSEDYWDKIRRG